MDVPNRFSPLPVFLKNNVFVWYAVGGLLGVTFLMLFLASVYTSGRNKVYLIKNPVYNSVTLQRYAISFKTSLIRGSGLPESIVVRVSLVGNKGSSPFVTLTRPLYPLSALCRGQEDTFLFNFERSVGEVCGVQLYLENVELLDTIWCLKEINVYDPQIPRRWHFPVEDDLVFSSDKRELRYLVNGQRKTASRWQKTERFLSLHSVLSLWSLPQEVGIMKMALKIILITCTVSLLYLSNLLAFVLSKQVSPSAPFLFILINCLLAHLVVWIISCVNEALARNIRPRWSLCEDRVDMTNVAKSIYPVCPCCQYYSDISTTHVIGCLFGVDGSGDKPAVARIKNELEPSSTEGDQLHPKLNEVVSPEPKTGLELIDRSETNRPRNRKLHVSNTQERDSKDISTSRDDTRKKILVDLDKLSDIPKPGFNKKLSRKDDRDDGKSGVSTSCKAVSKEPEFQCCPNINCSQMGNDVNCLLRFTHQFDGTHLQTLQNEIGSLEEKLGQSSDNNIARIPDGGLQKTKTKKFKDNQTDDDKLFERKAKPWSKQKLSNLEKMLQGFENDLHNDMETIRKLLEAEKSYNYDEYINERGSPILSCSSNSSADTKRRTPYPYLKKKRKRKLLEIPDTTFKEIYEHDLDELLEEIRYIDTSLHLQGAQSTSKCTRNVSRNVAVQTLKRIKKCQSEILTTNLPKPSNSLKNLSDVDHSGQAVSHYEKNFTSEDELSPNTGKRIYRNSFRLKRRMSSRYKRIDRGKLRLADIVCLGEDDINFLQRLLSPNNLDDPIQELEEEILKCDMALDRSGASANKKVQEFMKSKVNRFSGSHQSHKKESLSSNCSEDVQKINMTNDFSFNTEGRVDNFKDLSISMVPDTNVKDIQNHGSLIQGSEADESFTVKEFIENRRKKSNKASPGNSDRLCAVSLLGILDSSSQWLTNTDVFKSLTEKENNQGIHGLLQDIHCLDTSLKLSGATSDKSANPRISPKVSDNGVLSIKSCHNQTDLDVDRAGQFVINIDDIGTEDKNSSVSAISVEKDLLTPQSISQNGGPLQSSSQSREVIGLMKSIAKGEKGSNLFQNFLTDFKALDNILDENGLMNNANSPIQCDDNVLGNNKQSILKAKTKSERNENTRRCQELAISSKGVGKYVSSDERYTSSTSRETTRENPEENLFGRFMEDVRKVDNNLRHLFSVNEDLSAIATEDNDRPIEPPLHSSKSLPERKLSQLSCLTSLSNESRRGTSEELEPPSSASFLKAIACENSPRAPIRNILEEIKHFDKIIHESGACKRARNMLPSYLIVKTPRFYCNSSQDIQRQSLNPEDILLEGLASRSTYPMDSMSERLCYQSDTDLDRQSVERNTKSRSFQQDLQKNRTQNKDALKLLKSFVADPRDAKFLSLLQDIKEFDDTIDNPSSDSFPVKRLMERNVQWKSDREHEVLEFEPLRNYSSKDWNSEGKLTEQEKTLRKKPLRSQKKNKWTKEVTSTKQLENLSSEPDKYEDDQPFREDVSDKSSTNTSNVSPESGFGHSKDNEAAIFERMNTQEKYDYLMKKALKELDSFHELVNSLDGVDQSIVDNIVRLLRKEKEEINVGLSTATPSDPGYATNFRDDTTITDPDVTRKGLPDEGYTQSVIKSHSVASINEPQLKQPKTNEKDVHSAKSGKFCTFEDLSPRIKQGTTLIQTTDIVSEDNIPNVCNCVIEMLATALSDNAITHAKRELVFEYDNVLNVFHKFLVTAVAIDLLKKWKIPAHTELLDSSLINVYCHLEQQGYGRMCHPDLNLSKALLMQRVTVKSDNLVTLSLCPEGSSNTNFAFKLEEIMALERSLAKSLLSTYKKQIKAELRRFLKNIKDETLFGLSLELPETFLCSVFLYYLDNCVERTKYLPLTVFHESLSKDWDFQPTRNESEQHGASCLCSSCKVDFSEKLKRNSDVEKGESSGTETKKLPGKTPSEKSNKARRKGRKENEVSNIPQNITDEKSLERKKTGKQVSFNPKLDQTVTIPSVHSKVTTKRRGQQGGDGDVLTSVNKDVKHIGRYLQYVIYDEKKRQEEEVSDYCLANKDKLNNFLVENVQKIADFHQSLCPDSQLSSKQLASLQSEVCGYSRFPLPWLVYPFLMAFLCITIMSSLIYTVMKGEDLEPNESGWWIACVLIGVVMEVIFFQPLKIIIWTLCSWVNDQRCCGKKKADITVVDIV